MEKVMIYIKPFIAIAVLVLAVFSFYGLYKYNQLQGEIKENCGYQNGEKVYCVCDKQLVSNMDVAGNPYFDDSLNFQNLKPKNQNGG